MVKLGTRAEPGTNRSSGFYKTSAVPLGPTGSLAEGERGRRYGGWGGGMECCLQVSEAVGRNGETGDEGRTQDQQIQRFFYVFFFYKTSAVPLGPAGSLAEGEKGRGDGVGIWNVVCKCHKP